VPLEIVLVGLGVGFLLGLTSLGGGSLLTPILILFLRVDPVIAVGSDLVYQAVTRVAGLTVHVRQQAVDRRILVRLAVGSVPGAIAAGVLIHALHAKLGARATLSALGVALVLTALTIGLEPMLRRQRERGEPARLGRTRTLLTVAAGVLVGLCVGVTSVGAGSLAMCLVVLLYPHLTGRRLVGTDLAHGVILLPISAVVAAKSGHVDFVLVAQLLVGSVPGVILGSRLSARMPERPLRLTVAGMLLATGVRLLPVGL
jgi:uncharacterized membrane protein YfcA